MRRRLPQCAVVAVLVLAMAACGGDDDSDGSGSDGTGIGDGSGADLVILADDPPDFDRDSYSATVGEIAVEYRNDGSTRHTLLIEDVDGFELEVGAAGDVDTGTVELEAGDYVLYCDVSGHRAAGMEATLTVE